MSAIDLAWVWPWNVLLPCGAFSVLSSALVVWLALRAPDMDDYGRILAPAPRKIEDDGKWRP